MFLWALEGFFCTILKHIFFFKRQGVWHGQRMKMFNNADENNGHDGIDNDAVDDDTANHDDRT
jgi:hypothetical protein